MTLIHVRGILPMLFSVKDGVIWPSATAKMNTARCSEERETR